MTQSCRLDQGGRIDRDQPVNFRFNGKQLQGYTGDTLASALLANGISIVGRSFKLHRPRGLVGAGVEEPNALVQVGRGAATIPNLRATEVELFDGLEARSIRGWPSVEFDLAGLLDAFSRVFSAGFYYKTFMAPRRLWSLYEKMIRASAGWGTAPPAADPDHYEHRNAHCDVLIAGAGPAGLMAALAAARAGARVIIADDQMEAGGSLLFSSEAIDGQPAATWLATVLAELTAHPEVTVLTRSTVFGYYDHNFLAIAQRCTDHLGSRPGSAARQRLWRVRAKQVILCQGAIERPLVFCNNDRPGVMLASAVSAYLKRWAVLPGKQAVVFTNNDSAYQAALDLHEAGVAVAAVVDSRAQGAGEIRSRAEQAGIPILNGHLLIDVKGSKRVSEVSIAKWSGDPGQTVTGTMSIRCDLLAVSGGWNPAVHLHSQSGGRNTWNDEQLCFLPGQPAQASICAGAGNGAWDLDECLRQGLQAGNEATERCGLGRAELSVPATTSRSQKPIAALWRVPAAQDADRCPKQFIDFQNDTSVADIRLALREGYRNIEHVKRYTALGFGTDQGKLGNINGMAIVAENLGVPIADVGTTTFRPAYTPVSFGLCAGENVGELFDPVRKTALHAWHESAGAKFEVVGQWLRPHYFPRRKAGGGAEDQHAAVARECLACRSSLGILDASTLGKIHVQGPDAVRFLDLVYTHDVAAMEIGRCAYSVMLGEDGMVKDDGIMTRLGENEFYLTTTTGGAASVFSWMESWLQTELPEWQVYLTSLTDQYSTIALVGPNSRQLLQDLQCSTGLDTGSFPFMAMREAELCGVPVQLFRVSFTGELSFEINVDSRLAVHVWKRLMKAGEAYSITPYGTETMHVLRAEKGFFMVGQDTDGSVNPADLGLHWMLKKEADFLGRRSLARSDSLRFDRKQWVGLESLDGQSLAPEGSQLVDIPDAPRPVPMLGHVSSAYFSACLDKPIALGLVNAGRSRMGDTIFAISAKGERFPLKLVSPVFYDPKGERQRG